MYQGLRFLRLVDFDFPIPAMIATFNLAKGSIRPRLERVFAWVAERMLYVFVVYFITSSWSRTFASSATNDVDENGHFFAMVCIRLVQRTYCSNHLLTLGFVEDHIALSSYSWQIPASSTSS